MRRFAWVTLLLWVAVSMTSPVRASGEHKDHGAESAATEHGRCLVCEVLHGEAEDDPVRAKRTHAGREYGFCSENCAKRFAEDPLAYLPPTFPRPAPAFALVTLDARPVTVDSLRGKVTLVDFWATWCVPCRKSMPELQSLHERHRDRGFSVLGISIDEKAEAKVRRYVASQKFTYPIAIDDPKQPAWERYRVKAVPAAFLIDREGRIVAQWTGGAPPREVLEAAVERALDAPASPASGAE